MSEEKTEEKIMALQMPEEELDLSERQLDYLKLAEEKIGFVPNVLKVYGFHAAKFDAFTRMYNDLMLGESGLSKLEREMIAVTVSSANHCVYCLTAHGAAVRQLSGDPVLGEQLVMNYRSAELSPKQRAMLDFAWELTKRPETIDESDRQALREAGWSDRDVFDIASVAAFFNMTNRVSSAVEMRPNDQYHNSFRQKP